MKNCFALTLCLLLAASAARAAQPSAVDAARISHRNFAGGINSRLTVVQEMLYENPDAPAGSPLDTATYEPVDRLWIGGIRSSAELSGPGGYEYDALGFNTGYDWSVGDWTIGVAANFTAGTIQDKDVDAENKIEAANFALYAGRDPLCGLFYDATATYGMSWNRAHSNQVGGSGEGKFGATSFGLGGNIGYSFDFPLAKVTPTIGLRWTRFSQDAYTESGGGASTRFAEAENDCIEIPLAVRIGTSWQTGSGAVISPEITAAYIMRAGDRRSSVTMGTVGGSGSSVLQGADDGKNLARIGAGLKANITPDFDAFVDYSLELKSGYRSSNFNTGLGVSF